MPRALVVGVNYVGQDCELQGCANDAVAMAKFLAGRGYEVTQLIDSKSPEEKTRIPPTRRNILRGLADLILSGEEFLFFSFAGHGSREYDTSGDEADGKDEVLCPLDLDKGMITDDAIRGLLQLMEPHQKLFCILDCCHSGTGMDLKYEMYDRGGSQYRFLEATSAALTRTPGTVFMLSGCQDDQTSDESTVGQQVRGALTAATVPILESMLKTGTVSCSELLGAVRRALREKGHSQIAQLSSGQPVASTAGVPIH